MSDKVFEDLYKSQLNLILAHLKSRKPVPIKLLEAVKILARLLRLPEEMIEKLEHTLDRLPVESDIHSKPSKDKADVSGLMNQPFNKLTE